MGIRVLFLLLFFWIVIWTSGCSTTLGNTIDFLFFFFSGTRVWTQDSTLAGQVLYHLSHASSPFCSGYFGDGVCELFAWVSLKPWSSQS
jgi:hypothetical protein